MDYVPDELYAKILASVPIACVDVCIVHARLNTLNVLMVKRKDPPAAGEWWIPGGRVRKGETMEEAAKRLALEETGLECITGPILHTAETVFPDGPYGQSVHSINTCYLMIPLVGGADVLIPKLDSHHEKYAWVHGVCWGLHHYVRDCLLAVGLKAGSHKDIDRTYFKEDQ